MISFFVQSYDGVSMSKIREIAFFIKRDENIIPHQLNYTIHIKGNKTEFREIKVIIRQQIKFR